MAEVADQEPPLQRGEPVLFGEGRPGVITRAYVLEDKYAVKADGAAREVKGPNNSFFYFRRSDLRRIGPSLVPTNGTIPEKVVPDVMQADTEEPPEKKARVEPVPEREPSPPAVTGPPRFEGRVKWFSKEKGFGKILPVAVGGQNVEEVFVHRKMMEGGPEGPHAQAVAEGVLVTYEVTTSQLDGKPTAVNVQVAGVRSITSATDRIGLAQKEALVRKLLLSGMQIGTYQERGVGKAQMEDRMLIRAGIQVESLGSTCKKAVLSLFGVFDGHSGASCSDFVCTNLDRSVFECLRHQNKRDVNSDMATRSALQAGFRQTEHNFFQYANRLEAGPAAAWANAGSTACTTTFFGPDEEGRLRLAVANAGDSRAVLGRKDCRAVRLSEDHTPDVPTERKRIESEGAAVVQAGNGIWRIVLPSKKGTGMAGLSVSRGFGDIEYKQGCNVVSAVPDIYLSALDLREDCFVIIASDGVWGPISDGEAVRIVANTLREGGEEPAANAARTLLEIAHQRDGHDDKTVIVIWFGDLPNAPQHVPSAERSSRQSSRSQNAAVRGAPGIPGIPGPVQLAGADDMFAQGTRAALEAKLHDLDNLFASYAKDLGSPGQRSR